MDEEIIGIETIQKIGDKWVIYENDYGTNNGLGYALLYEEDWGYFERYHIKRYIKDRVLHQEPDLDKPFPYPNGTNLNDPTRPKRDYYTKDR